MATSVPDFPLPVRMEFKRDGSVESAFLSEIDRIVDGGKRKFEEFGQEARRQVDQALSVKRNDFGSLDLGVPQLRAAAAAQEARAIAAREVAQATRLAAQEIGDEGTQARLTLKAIEALAREEEQAAAAARSHASAAEQVQDRLNRQASATQQVVAATRQGTTATTMMVNSTRAMRNANIQAGQQLQDIVISLQSGQRATTVFAQQLPQLAFAFSGVGGKIGAAARFLSGPWGAGILLATLAAGPFIAKLLGIGEAAEKGGSAISRLSNRLDLSKNSYSTLIEVVNEYNAAQERTEVVTLRAAEAARIEAGALLKKAEAQVIALQARDPTAGAGSALDAISAQGAQDQLVGFLQSKIDKLKQDVRNAERAVADITIKGQLDPVVAAQQAADERLRIIEEEQEKGIRSTESYHRERLRIERETERKIAALRDQARAGRSKVERSPRDPGETATFIRPVEGGSISGRYGEQRTGRRHAGIDYAVPVGTNVQAAQSGVVVTVANLPGYGNTVIVDHGGGTSTRYAHLSKVLVGKGDAVTQGQSIALSGGARGAPGAGNSRGPHLHFETRRNGKAVDPSGGAFPIDAAKVAEEAQKAKQALEEFGSRAGQAIQSVSDRFDEQPRLIDQSAAAVADMTRLIEELQSKNKDGIFDAQIEAAQKARVLAEGAVDTQISKMRQSAEEEYRIRLLILEGRDREAAVVQQIATAEERFGKELLPAQRAELEAIAKLEFDRAEAIERAMEMQSAYLDATRSVRGEVESIIAGTGKLSNFKQIFRNLNARVLTEQVFGDVFRDLDEYVKRETGIGSSVDMLKEETERGASALSTFTDVVLGEADRLRGGSGGGGAAVNAVAASLAGAGGFVGSIGYDLLAAAQGIGGRAAGAAGNDNELVVVGKRQSGPRSLIDLTPEEYIKRTAEGLGGAIGISLSKFLGTRAGNALAGPLGGALGGYAMGGAPGAALGLLTSLSDIGKSDLEKQFDKVFGRSGIGGKLEKALGGTATGTAVAGIGKSLGIGISTSGSQIGGSLGALTGIPGGDIIGAIAGGIIGKMISGTKRGSATIGGLNGALGITGTGGNSGSFIKAASGSADGIISSVERIAEALGASMNAALGSVTVGIRDGKYRVDASGSGITKTSKGAIDFGKDGQAAAIQYATLDLIKDGVIVGLRAGTQRLLQNAKDLETGLQRALDFEGVFNQLKAIKDPVGAAIDAVDKEFVRLRQIAVDAGEGLVEVEELYGIKRAEAIKQAQAQLLGPLDDLLRQLTIGDSGLSLRDRRDAAMAEYTPLADRVRAGDTTAFADFASAASTLLDINRQVYGSQQGYFDFFNEVRSLTTSARDAQKVIADAAAGRDNPFTTPAANDNAGVVDAINNQTTAFLAALNAANDNLGTIIAALIANGGGNFPDAPIGGTNYF